MLFLKIFGAIVLGIILILCIPVSVCAKYDETFEVKIKYLFLNIPVVPGKEKKKKHKKTKKVEHKEDGKTEKKTTPHKTKKDNILIEFYHNSGFSQTVKLIRDVANIVGKYLNSLFVRHLVVSELFLELVVAGDDSADTAEKFGKISAAVFPSLGFLSSKLKIRNRNVTVRPDFLGEKSTAKFHVELRFKPFWLLNSTIYAGIKLLLQFIKVASVNSNAKKTKQKYVKKSTEK